jgi:signal transduction histidine kinase
MPRAGVIAALQAAGPEAGTTLTVGAWGVFVLALLVAAAAAGWVLLAVTRRRGREAGAPAAAPSAAPPSAARSPEAPPASPPPPAPPSPPEDALLAAFRTASGLADAVLLCREGKVERATAEGLDVASIHPGTLPGLPVASLAAPEDVLVLAEAIRRTEAGGAPTEVWLRLAGRSPAARAEVQARIVRPPGAPAGSCLIFLRDARSPAALARGTAEMTARVEAALRHLGQGILVTAVEAGREVVVLANPALEKLLGIPPQALAGHGLDEARARLAGSLPEEVLEALLPAGEEAGAAVVEIRSEPRLLVERTSRPVAGRAGARGRLLTYRDVTQERAREEELRRAAEEAQGARQNLEAWHEQIALANEGLERRMGDLARLNRDLRILDDMKSNLLENVSHELQTPLVSIKGYTEMILKGRLGPLTEEQERGLRVALRNIDRLIALIDGLLTFARAEKDAVRLRLSVFPLRPLVDEVVELIKDKAADRRVGIAVKFPSGDLSIRGDRDRIAQVLINLLTNAVKYNREGGGIVVEAVRARRSQARVEVRDTGSGIPREELDRIFERYYRGAEAGAEGRGLGLAIAKDILRLHGCTIRAESEPGKGSTFAFTLPLEPRARGEKPTPAGPDGA